MASHKVGDRAVIHQQLALARQTLQKLRSLSDTKPEVTKTSCGYSSQNSYVQNGYSTQRNPTLGNSIPPCVVSSSRNYFGEFESSASGDNNAGNSDHAKPLRENLVKKLGLQGTKLEDDLKVSLLSYLEEVELQKEELIKSFHEMQLQLLQHQKSCQDQHKQAVEKEVVIQKLRASKEALQKENNRLKRDAMRYGSNSSLPVSEESYLENQSSLSSSPQSFHSHLVQNGNNDLQESLIEENARLRELLYTCDNNEVTRLEHKVGQHEELNDAFTKELRSKENLIKKLKAENLGLRTDVQSLENEMLRVNASRLNAEKQKDQFRRDLQFSDEQINDLKLKLKNITEEKQYLKRAMNDTKERADNCEGNLVTLERELLDLKNSGENSRNKIKEKERCIMSLKEDNCKINKTCDTLRKELSIAKNEAYGLRCERDRFQRDSTDKEIEFMNSKANDRANQNQIQELKRNLHVAEIKLSDFENKCQQYERNEAKLNQEVLANVEKYTQAEKELFLTKKEQAKLRGLYDSSENRKNRLQADLETAKQQIRTLENDVQARRKPLLNAETSTNDLLRKENQTLQNEIRNLHGVISSSAGNLQQLQTDFNDAKEQLLIQKMKADNSETLLKQKDEKIKRLQDEVVEVHSQNDALTDQLLKKNRDIERLKDTKMLLEQEVQSLKTRAVLRGTDISNRAQIEPATSDSGISEIDCSDREKIVNRLQNEMDFKLNQDKAKAKIQELQVENEILKEQERETRETLNIVQEKLEEFAKENEELRNKVVGNLKQQQSLQDELIEIIPDFQENGFGELQATPEFDSFMEEEFAPKRASSRIDMDNEELRAQNEALNQSTRELEEQLRQESENLNELLSQREQLLEELKKAKSEAKEFSKSFAEAEEEKYRLLNKTEQLQGEIIDLKEKFETQETNLWKIQEEREMISEELRKTKENVNQLQQIQESEQIKSKELEETLMQEMLVKEQDIVSLQNQLASVNDKCMYLESCLETVSDNRDTEVENELLEAKNKCTELENELKSLQEKEMEYSDMLGVAKGNVRTLTAELQNTICQKEEATLKLHELQQDFALAETEIEKLSKKTMAMKKDAERDQEKQEESETMMINLETEKRQLQQKLREAEGQIEKLEKVCEDVQGRKEIAVETMRESLQRKDQKITDLNNELSLHELKYAELEGIMETTKEKHSGLNDELLELKEKLVELQHEKDDLLQRESVLKEVVSEREEQLVEVKCGAEEAVRQMQERDDEFHEILRTMEELEISNKNLKEENELILQAAQESDEKLTDAVKNLKEIEEEKKAAVQELKVAQESISDLETAFEEGQDENMELKRKLERADERLRDLIGKNSQLIEEVKRFEVKRTQQEADFETIEKSLLAQNDRVDELQTELNTAENKLTLLEEAKEMSQNQEQLLQEKALNALQSLNEIEIENARLKSQHSELEKTLAKDKQKQNDMEENIDGLKKLNEDISRELEIERENVWAVQDELESKQKELKRTQKELQRHKIELEESETIQAQEMYKKAKLKDELLQANKQIEELEVEKETRQRENEQLEKQLNTTREKIASLENTVEEMTKENEDFKGQTDEIKLRLKSSANEISDLEKMLQQQKELCEDYRRTLVERDETILNLNFSRDAADGALQSVKSDLVQKESVCKTKNDQIERLQYELNRTQKKLDKTDVFYEKKCLENEKLQKEVSDLKRRIVELEKVRVDRDFLSSQMENYKRIYSMQATSTTPARSAEEKVRDWDDKLERAQSRVTDALSELSKDIRRQEQNTFRSGTSTARNRTQFHFDDTGEDFGWKTKSFDRSSSYESVLSDSSELLDGSELTTKKTYKQEVNEKWIETDKNEDSFLKIADTKENGKQKNDKEKTSAKDGDEDNDTQVRSLPSKPDDLAISSKTLDPLLSAPASFADKQVTEGNYGNGKNVTVAPPPEFDTTGSKSKKPQAASPGKETLSDAERSARSNEEIKVEQNISSEFTPQDFEKYFVPSKPTESSLPEMKDVTKQQQDSESDNLLLDFMPTEIPDTNSFSYDVTKPNSESTDFMSTEIPDTNSFSYGVTKPSSASTDFMPTEIPDTNSFSYDVTKPDSKFTDLNNEKDPCSSQSPPLLNLLQTKVPNDMISFSDENVDCNGQQLSNENDCAESGAPCLDSTTEELVFSTTDGNSTEMFDPEAMPLSSLLDSNDSDSPKDANFLETTDNLAGSKGKNETDKSANENEQNFKTQNNVAEPSNSKKCKEESQGIESLVDRRDEPKDDMQGSPGQYVTSKGPILEPEREIAVSPGKDRTMEEIDKTSSEEVRTKPEENCEEKEIPFQAVKIGIDSQTKTATRLPTMNEALYSHESTTRTLVIREFEKKSELEQNKNNSKKTYPVESERVDSPRDFGKLASPNETRKRMSKGSNNEDIFDTEKETEKDLKNADEDGEHCQKPSEFLKQFEKRVNLKENPEITKPKPAQRASKRRETLMKNFENHKHDSNTQDDKQPKEMKQSLGEPELSPKTIPRPKPRHKLVDENEKRSPETLKTSPGRGEHLNKHPKPPCRPIEVEIEIEKPVKEPSAEFRFKKSSEIVIEIESQTRTPVLEPHPLKQESNEAEVAVPNTASQYVPKESSSIGADSEAEPLDTGRQRVMKLIAAFEGKEV